MRNSFMSGLGEIATACRRTPNMYVLIWAGIIAQFAGGILNPVLPLFLRSRGLSFQSLGVIFSVAALAPVVLQPVVGWAADRIGRKIMIVGSSLILSLLLPVYVFLNNVQAFAVLHAARSAVAASGHPAHDAMMGDVMPKQKRATLFGVYGSLLTFAYVVALFGSGQLLRLGVDYNAAFYVSSVLFVASSLTLAIWLKETHRPQRQPASQAEPARGWLKAVVGFFGFALQTPELAGLILLRFFFAFGLAVYPMYVPLLAREMGAPVTMVGPIVATAWLTYAVMQPLGGRLSDRSKRGRVDLMLIGVVILVLAGLGVGLSATIIPFVICWAATGIGDGLFRPGLHALVVDLVPAAGRGQYFGASGAIMTVGGVTAPLLYGYVAHHHGISRAILISPASWFVGAAIIVALLIRVHRHKDRTAGRGVSL